MEGCKYWSEYHKDCCIAEHTYEQGVADTIKDIKDFAKNQLDCTENGNVAMAYCVILGYLEEKAKREL